MGGSRIEVVETRLGQPKVIGTRRGRPVWSSIDRQPVEADRSPSLYCTWTGLAGDRPTETRPKTAAEGGSGLIHGGPDKAVYVFPTGHYASWLVELGTEAMGQRSFGENWRLVGATEHDVHIGDVWRFGEAEFVVSKPRQPCDTLRVYYRLPMIKLMAANGLCGWYLAVRRPGLVPTVGPVEVVGQNLEGPTVAEAFAAKMRRT